MTGRFDYDPVAEDRAFHDQQAQMEYLNECAAARYPERENETEEEDQDDE